MNPNRFPAADRTTLDHVACIQAEIDIAGFLDGVGDTASHGRLFDHVMVCDLCLQALLECMAHIDPPLADGHAHALDALGTRLGHRVDMRAKLARASTVDPHTSRMPHTPLGGRAH